MKRMFKMKEESIIAAQSGIGMWAFLMHRVSGLSLIFYLLMHIIVISTSLNGARNFNVLLSVLTSPPFLALDLALLAAVLFHALNGFRILLFDLGIGIRVQKPLFWLVILICGSVWIYTLIITLPYIIGNNL